MSLINDALKRASQTEKNRAAGRTPTAAGMEAVPETRSSMLTTVLSVAVVVLLALAVVFFWQWNKARNGSAAPREAAVSAPVIAQADPAPAPTPAPKPAPVAAAPRPTPAPVVKSTPAPVVATPIPQPIPAPAPVAAAPQPAPAQPAPRVWPTDLKVTAIFFSRTNPRVMISGNVYGVGDDVEGTRIKKIYTDKVIIGMDGQTRELSLEEP